MTYLQRSPCEAFEDLRMNYFDFAMSYLEVPLAAPGLGKSQGRHHNLAFLHHQFRSAFHCD